jgi:hypothetical protein
MFQYETLTALTLKGLYIKHASDAETKCLQAKNSSKISAIVSTCRGEDGVWRA